jgi:two-component system response regulator FixJ
MLDPRPLVLIVDGDRAVRDAFQFALQLEGLDVHAHSGEAELLSDPDLTRADCVILDNRMSRMDGFRLLSLIRERNIRLPAILLTSHATTELLARASAAGVRLVLEKPLLDNALTANVLSILNDSD